MGRHTNYGFRLRFIRPAGAALALVVVLLAAAWFIGAAGNHSRAQTRAKRAADLKTLIQLVGRERQLISANRTSTSFTAAQIRSTSSALMAVLQRLGTSAGPAHNFAELRIRYGGAVYAAEDPRQAGTVRRALVVIGEQAGEALAADEEAALRGPRVLNALGTAEVIAAALAGLLGSGLLLWLGFGRPKGASRFEERVQQLSEQARTDSLTRLGNHRAFQDDLTAAITTRASTSRPFSLMAIDLDGLKRINDTKGHPAGDAHIRRVAECLQTVVKDAGTVYRTGGDEFMILLPGRRNWHGLTLASRIDQATRIATGGRAVSIGLTESVGMEGRHLLVHQADIALYEAKRTKLGAVTYHPGIGLGNSTPEPESGPSRDQRTLAAALARAVDAKDVGTRSHSETVAELCVAIGQRLDLEPRELERLRLAGLLHDVGKIGVADSILQKPEPLGPDEQSAMTEHVEIGHAILLAAELPTEAHWVLHHHERYDGSGYPECLSGTGIPIQSRIISVADAFEAMTGNRPYRQGMPTEDALEEIRAAVGRQFDPDCVDALVAVVYDAETAGVRGDVRRTDDRRTGEDRRSGADQRADVTPVSELTSRASSAAAAAARQGDGAPMRDMTPREASSRP